VIRPSSREHSNKVTRPGEGGRTPRGGSKLHVVHVGKKEKPVATRGPLLEGTHANERMMVVLTACVRVVINDHQLGRCIRSLGSGQPSPARSESQEDLTRCISL
jgi:hypothetical protein